MKNPSSRLVLNHEKKISNLSGAKLHLNLENENNAIVGAAQAQWIRMRLPSSVLGLKP